MDKVLKAQRWEEGPVPAMYIRDSVIEHQKMVMVLYVDDILIIGERNEIAQCMNDISQCVEVGRVGYIDESSVQFTGAFLKRIDSATIRLSQKSYVRKLVSNFEERVGKSLRGRNTQQTYAESELPIVPIDEIVSYSEETDLPRSDIGSLMYPGRATRPDILYEVSRMAKHVTCWGDDDRKHMHDMMSYLKGTSNVSIFITSSHDPEEQLILSIYTDSDHGAASDKKSQSGTAIVLQGDRGTTALLSWVSKAQASVSLSSTEAEIGAIVDSLRHADEIIDFLHAAGLKFRVELRVDNDSARLAATRGLSSKLAYISKTRKIQMCWIPVYLESISAECIRVDTKLNCSDLMTKILPKIRAFDLMRIMGVRDDDNELDS